MQTCQSLGQLVTLFYFLLLTVSPLTHFYPLLPDISYSNLVLPPLTCSDSIMLLLPALTGSHQLLHTFTSTVLLLTTLSCSYPLLPAVTCSHMLFPDLTLSCALFALTPIFGSFTTSCQYTLISNTFICSKNSYTSNQITFDQIFLF